MPKSTAPLWLRRWPTYSPRRCAPAGYDGRSAAAALPEVCPMTLDDLLGDVPNPYGETACALRAIVKIGRS
jgi:hypothetical protein